MEPQEAGFLLGQKRQEFLSSESQPGSSGSARNSSGKGQVTPSESGEHGSKDDDKRKKKGRDDEETDSKSQGCGVRQLFSSRRQKPSNF